MTRTIDEIYKRLKNEPKLIEDALNYEFYGKLLVQFLPKEKLIELGFEASDKFKPASLTDEEIIRQMKDYFDFAVDKALGQRGISASRSIAHYKAWIWLLGDDEFLQEIENSEYAPYGVPILTKIGKKYGFDEKLIKKLEELVIRR